MAKRKKGPKKTKPMAIAGRQEWQINPRTRVVPNKKKTKPQRKEKHKGRLFSRPSSFLAAA